MNICFTLDDTIYRYGGVQLYILQLADWLINNNHSVTILYCGNHNVAKYKLNENITYIPISKGFDIKLFSLNGSVASFPGFAQASQIKHILLKHQFDAIVFNYPFSPFVSGKIIKIVKKLYKQQKIHSKLMCNFPIHVEESIPSSIGSYLLATICRPALKAISVFTHISAPAGFYGEKYVKTKSTYLPIGLEDISITKTRKEYVEILFLGRLEERKGVLDLIKALEIVHSSVQSRIINVKIAGNGPQKQEAEKLAQELISKTHTIHIQFLGRVSEAAKAQLYTQSDIAIFPSKYGESFGIVLLEAMNYSCSIIGYDNSGYVDTLREFAADCLVKSGDVPALAQKIIEYIESPEEMIYKRSAHLKEFFSIHYSLNKIGNDFIQLCKN